MQSFKTFVSSSSKGILLGNGKFYPEEGLGESHYQIADRIGINDSHMWRVEINSHDKIVFAEPMDDSDDKVTYKQKQWLIDTAMDKKFKCVLDFAHTDPSRKSVILYDPLYSV